MSFVVENLAGLMPCPREPAGARIEGVSLVADSSGGNHWNRRQIGLWEDHISASADAIGSSQDGQAGTWDGVPLESLACDSFARALGYVGQSPFVFSSTVGENIAYEREGATLEGNPPCRSSKLHRSMKKSCRFQGGFDALNHGTRDKTSRAANDSELAATRSGNPQKILPS